MQRVPNVILFLVNAKTSPTPTVLTHHLYVNRIPCLEEDLFEHNMIKYVQKEMESYPITKAGEQKKLQEDPHLLRHRKSMSTQLMKFAYDLINQPEYLLIEEIRQTLHSLNQKEIGENQVTIQMLKKSVNECITRQSLGQLEVLEIRVLLKEITDLQDRRSSKIF